MPVPVKLRPRPLNFASLQGYANKAVVNTFTAGAGGVVLVTMAIAHGFGTGRSVSIPDGLYKGTWFITVVDQLSYTLDGSVYTVDDGGGGISPPPASAPSPAFTINNLTPTTAQTVTATITNQAAGGTPTSGTIDWGDGNGQIALTGSFVSASLMYASAGTYTVVVRLTNAVGTGTSTRTNYLTVSAPTVHTTTLSSSGAFNFTVGSTSRSVTIIGAGADGDDAGASGGAGGGAGAESTKTFGSSEVGYSYNISPANAEAAETTYFAPTSDGVDHSNGAEVNNGIKGVNGGAGGTAIFGTTTKTGGSGGAGGVAGGGGGGGAGGTTGNGGNGVAGGAVNGGAGGTAGTGGTLSGTGGNGGNTNQSGQAATEFGAGGGGAGLGRTGGAGKDATGVVSETY